MVWQKQRQRQNLLLERNGALRSAWISAPQKYLTLPTLLETNVSLSTLLEHRQLPGFVDLPSHPA